jgi:hypothetical protein
MNDPGLDGPITSDADAVENEYGDKKEEETEIDDYMMGDRWWMASTGLCSSESLISWQSVLTHACVHSIPADGRNVWSYGQCLLNMRFGSVMESVYTSWRRGRAWRYHHRSKMVCLTTLCGLKPPAKSNEDWEFDVA